MCNSKNGKNYCPLDGKCLPNCIVYSAEVTTNNENKALYIGLAENSFKQRYTNHLSSFNNIQYKDSTALSKYIWDLKNKEKKFEIKWSILKKTNAYHPKTRICNLCLTEKTLILISTHPNLLNKRSELINTCRHRKKYLLSSVT